MENPIITIKMQGGAEIKAELFPKTAPNTVKSFINLIQEGFYNGMGFVRSEKGALKEFGDPTKNYPDCILPPKAGYLIENECSTNGFDPGEENRMSFKRGTIGTGTLDPKHCLGGDFFILAVDGSMLDGAMPVFGNVIEGMEVVDNFSEAELATEEGLKRMAEVLNGEIND